MQKQGKKLLALGLTTALAFTSVFTGSFNATDAKAAPNTTKSNTTDGGAITKKDGAKYAYTTDVYVPDNPAPFKDLTSDELISNMGNGWNLGNTLDGHSNATPSETAWLTSKVTTSQEFITYLHDIGYNTIRIPVTWGKMINDDDDYSINEEWMSRVQDVVDYAINENMYVILNIHHDGADGSYWLNLDADEESDPNSAKYDKNWTNNWNNGGWAGVKEKFAGVWTTISDRFKNYDEHLIFEGMNEVFSANKGGWTSDTDLIKAQTAQINELNQLFVDTVRTTGGNNEKRWIMASALNTNIGYATNQLAGFTIPTDVNGQKRIMLSVHDYDAFSNTAYNESNTASYAGQFKTLYEKFVKNGVPVVVGEYGFKKGILAMTRATQFEGVNYLLKKYHLVGCVWDDNGDYRLLNRGYMKPYSALSIVGTLRGFFKDKAAPTVISYDNYKEYTNTNITELALDASEVSLAVGEEKTIKCTETPASNNDVVLWSSSDSTVASVYNGKIVARGIGEATITARTMSSDLLDSKAADKTIKVTVTKNTLDNASTEITTDFDAYTLNKGNEAFLNATVTPANGASVSYSSSNPAVVTVSTVGKLTALKIGSSKITIRTSDGLEKEVPVTVAPATVSSFKSTLALRIQYNYNKTADDYYGDSEEAAQTIDVTKDGQYSLTFDCATDLSEKAKDFGISTLNGIGALYIQDTAVTSEVKTGEIVYDSIVVNDTTELKISNKNPKSIMKGSRIDTGDPINGWDGSVVSDDDITTSSNGSVTFKNISNPTKITVTFTLSGLSTESSDDSFFRGTDEDVTDDDIKLNTDPENPGDSGNNGNNGGNGTQNNNVISKTASLKVASKAIIAAGSSKTIAYEANVAAGASKLANVTASSNYSKVKVSVNQATKKLTIKVDKSATKGKVATITLASSGAKSVKLKVYVKNPTKKVKASKKSLTLKKKKSKTLTVKITAANKKLATTDTVKVTSSKKAVAKIVSKKLKAGKLQIKVKALKKGNSKINVKIGSKKATIKLKVK